MLAFLKALFKGLKIFINNYSDVVNDIDKQASELSKLQDPQARNDVYNYLQRLVKLHSELFNITWTAVIATLALMISIVALFMSFK